MPWTQIEEAHRKGADEGEEGAEEAAKPQLLAPLSFADDTALKNMRSLARLKPLSP